MGVASLLADIKARGILLSTDGNTIRWKPKSALSPEEVEILRKCKAVAIGLLVARRNRADPLRVPPGPDCPCPAHPLLPAGWWERPPQAGGGWVCKLCHPNPNDPPSRE